MVAERIHGPLSAWYDIHEALAHEAHELAAQARTLVPAEWASFTKRYRYFESELRLHSLVEDGVMFPALSAAGGHIDAALGTEHHRDALMLYDLQRSLMEAQAFADRPPPTQLAATMAVLDATIGSHFVDEEEHVLPQVGKLFDDAQQARLLQAILQVVPPDPHLEPWIVGAITPEHRTARLRNFARSLPREALQSLLRQIHDGVTPDVWSDITRNTPELAAML